MKLQYKFFIPLIYCWLSLASHSFEVINKIPSISDSKTKESYFKNIGKNYQYGVFDSSAHVSSQSIPKLVVSDQLAFSLPREITPASLGWHIDGNLLTWQGEMGQAQSLSLPLQHASQPQAISLNDFDALWLDYSGASSIALCNPQITLATQTRSYVSAPKIGEAVWSMSTAPPTKVLNSVSAQESEWGAMDNYYFMGRQLRLKPDERWRYRQSDKFTLLQRRMHLNLKDALVMEVAIKPGSVLERVNLMVNTKDNLGKGEIVEFNNLPLPTLLLDGRLVLKLDLSAALKRSFPDAFTKASERDGVPPLFLQEIFFYFPGNTEKITANKPLLGFNLIGDINLKDNYFFNRLTNEDVALNVYSRRLKIDLRPINAEGKVELKKIHINLALGPNESECAIQIKTVRLVGTYNQKVPVFARQVEDWSLRWGGPFKLTAPEFDQIENPGIISYLPLNKLVEQTNESVDFHFEPQKSDRAVAKAQPSNVKSEIYQVNSKGNFYQAASGAGLTAAGGMISEPNAQWHWQVNASIGPDTFFFAASESTEQIAGLAITMHTADGRRLKRLVSTNTAVPLVTTPTHIKSLHIAISPRALPYHLKIKELVLFEPSVISYTEAFQLRLPRELSFTPKPIPLDPIYGSLNLRPGHASGLVRGDLHNFKFTTKLDTPLEIMSGLSLKFRLPPQIDTGGPCPLGLTFKFERATFQRQLCPNSLTAQLFVPLAAWLGKDAAGPNLGALQSIDWAIQLPVTHAKDQLASFSLDFSIKGWAYQSAADRLLSTPLFTLNGKPVYAKKDSLPADSAKLTNKLWLPLEQDAVNRLLDSSGEITIVENDLFKLDQVVLEPTIPIDREISEKLTNPPKPFVPPRWPKWLFGASLLLLAWASARKGLWSPAKTWLFVKRLISTLFWAVSKSTSYLGRRLWFMLPWTAAWEARLEGLARLIGWSIVTMVLYGAGLFQRAQKGENYFFTFGGMAALMTLRAIILLLKPWLRRAHPKLAKSIFDGPGSLYFAAAIVGLVLTALLITAMLEPFAEQMAVVVYYCLVVGTALELMALRRDQKSQAETATPPAQERPVT
jgi:hypothetical protein